MKGQKKALQLEYNSYQALPMKLGQFYKIILRC